MWSMKSTKCMFCGGIGGLHGVYCPAFGALGVFSKEAQKQSEKEKHLSDIEFVNQNARMGRKQEK